MEPVSDFELAQQRLKVRQRKQLSFIFWMAAFFILIAANVVFGGSVAGWLIPLHLLTLGMAISNVIELYYSSPRRPLRRSLIDQEMEWLFGGDWANETGAQEYTFAQDRIRRRRLDRWLFFFHMLLAIPVNLFILNGPTSLGKYGQEPVLFVLCYGIPLIWLLLLCIPHAWRTFPPKSVLAMRERRAAEMLKLEMMNMRPEKMKNQDKPKRDVQYRIGEDGELVEVNNDFTFDQDDKPKRNDYGI